MSRNHEQVRNKPWQSRRNERKRGVEIDLLGLLVRKYLLEHLYGAEKRLVASLMDSKMEDVANGETRTGNNSVINRVL